MQGRDVIKSVVGSALLSKAPACSRSKLLPARTRLSGEICISAFFLTELHAIDDDVAIACRLNAATLDFN
jgi:hypothetical protein